MKKQTTSELRFQVPVPVRARLEDLAEIDNRHIGGYVCTLLEDFLKELDGIKDSEVK